MSDRGGNGANGSLAGPASGESHTPGATGAATSRRDFLKAGAALATGSAATFNNGARAQQQKPTPTMVVTGAGDADVELRRLIGARRILIKHVTALTVDP